MVPGSPPGGNLVLVAEGGRTPTRIPVRDERGALQGYQKDDDGNVIETQRRDDILAALAKGWQGDGHHGKSEIEIFAETAGGVTISAFALPGSGSTWMSEAPWL